ncbi:MAG: EAL domain-containing protein [Rhodocyclaceae bacterium]
MTLLTRLWLCALAAMLLALAGSFVVSMRMARDYQAQQLYAQASDSAASLALSMSQQSKDAAMLELQVQALFDSGHFESIVLRGVDGKVLVERHNTVELTDAPGWFMALWPLQAEAGRAQVSDGWKQAGSLELRASTRYAYGALWQGSIKLAVTLLLIGLSLGLVINRLMRWLRTPLEELVTQAQAIGERRFVAVPESRVPELRVVSQAMNAMVVRLQAMFAEQAQRIENLRTEARQDSLSGLPNRDHFMGNLREQLDADKASSDGVLLLVRLNDLAGFNHRLGRERGDALVKACSRIVQSADLPECEVIRGRLGGAEFALLLPDTVMLRAAELAHIISAQLDTLVGDGIAEVHPVATIGWTAYEPGESVATVMTRIDAALLQAGTASPPLAGLAIEHSAGVMSGEDWRATVERALANRSFELVAYPVVRTDSALLHAEVMMRLVADDGTRVVAGQFVPAVQRQGRLAELDLLALDLALARLATQAGDVAVNISPSSLLSDGFIAACDAHLASIGAEASRVWLEVSERILVDEAGLKALAQLSEVTHRRGSKLGIEHFGRYFAALPRLHEVRIDYVKLDGAFVSGVDGHEGNRRFVSAVMGIARSLEIAVIAERVETEAEWQALTALEVSGLTGPAVTRRLAG